MHICAVYIDTSVKQAQCYSTALSLSLSLISLSLLTQCLVLHVCLAGRLQLAMIDSQLPSCAAAGQGGHFLSWTSALCLCQPCQRSQTGDRVQEEWTEREMDRAREPLMEANEKMEEVLVTADRKRNEGTRSIEAANGVISLKKKVSSISCVLRHFRNVA